MNRFKIIFSVSVLVIACLWLGFQGYRNAKTYYVTVQELLEGSAAAASGDRALRVGGDVKPGSIQRSDKLRFELMQGALSVPILYVGADTVPDTFSDRAQAVVDGHYDAAQGVFLAEKIQAKCASKYESKGIRKVSSFQGPANKRQSEIASPPARNDKAA